MIGRQRGPRRSDSVDAYRRGTRLLAGVALVALTAGVVSDGLAGEFWASHTLLAGLVASLIVVMLTAALLNEALERRGRRRWSVLAQYVMLQFVRDARLAWTSVASVADLMPSDLYAAAGNVQSAAAAIEAGSAAVRDTDRITAALSKLLAHPESRRRLHHNVTLLLEHSDAVLGRWAAVMLNADVYAEVIDRHVELAGDLAWLSSLLGLETTEERGDGPIPKMRSHPAALLEAPLDDQRLVQRLVAITQLAEELDRGTQALALKIVPIDWWRQQLAADPAAS